MNTNDIIKSLGMMSPAQMPPRLINEIAAALQERDELRAAATDLLRALESIEFSVYDCCPGCHTERPNHQKWCKIGNALAKARNDGIDAINRES